MPKNKPLPSLPGYSCAVLEQICADKKLERTHVKRLGRLFEYFDTQIDDAIGPEPAQFHHWITSVEGYSENLRTAHAYLHGTSRVFRALYGSSPFLRAMEEATLKLWHDIKPRKDKSEHKPKKLTFSVPTEALPALWQTAIADMKAGHDGIDCPAPAPSIVTSQIRKICELAKVCADQGMEMTLSVETTVAYERSLVGRERPLSATTLKSSMQRIRDFARYIGAPDDLVLHLRERTRFHESRAAKQMPLKELKVEKIPTYTEIFEDAFDLLGKADATRSKRVAQKCRNFAAALTLMCPFPLRVADTHLAFGDNVTWDGERYQLFIPNTSKTKDPFQARIAPFFGIFIDQLVLQGSDTGYLDDLRDLALRKRRPLFESHGCEPVFDGYVSYVWREIYGTGSHIARTKIHNELAVFGLKGVEGALRACGHRSERSAEHYRTRAFELLAGDHARKTAENAISEEEWTEYFDAVVERNDP